MRQFYEFCKYDEKVSTLLTQLRCLNYLKIVPSLAAGVPAAVFIYRCGAGICPRRTYIFCQKGHLLGKIVICVASADRSCLVNLPINIAICIVEFAKLRAECAFYV